MSPRPPRAERSSRTSLVVGLMSGTSADGIEAVLLGLRGAPPTLGWKLLAHRSFPFDPGLSARVIEAASGAAWPAADFAALDAALGEVHAAAVLELLVDTAIAPSEVEAIGFHGQTIFHQGPRESGARVRATGGVTWQIGSAAVLAERTGIRVVHDFRSADVAAGGEGAPLVPYVDWLLFRSEHVARALLNLGGIGNLTAMPAGASPDALIAFDTGPANMLLDGIVRHYSGGRLAYDEDGERAEDGAIDEALLGEALADPFFAQPPPRSTGRERFGAEFLERWFAAARQRDLSEADLLVTAAVLAATTVAQAIERFVTPTMALSHVYASGGGTKNPVLMAALAAALDPIELKTSDELGLAVEAKEAAAFAVLAYEAMHRRPGSLPAVTGAGWPVVLGSITLGPTPREFS